MWHLKWDSFYGARLDSIVARISDEEIKMAKRGTKQRLWIETISKVARVKLRASRISKYHIKAYRGK
jgi:hypothetical protein